MVKKIFITLLGIFVLAAGAIIALVFLTPTDYRVEREITINKPQADIINYAKLLKNQNNEWGPWTKKDPNIKINYKGTDGEPGFISSWESSDPQVGVGEQEIKKITNNEIDTELRFKVPFESTSQAFMILESVSPTQTKVRWGFSGSTPRPMNVMMLLFDMDKEVGKDFNEGLTNLKTILEKQ